MQNNLPPLIQDWLTQLNSKKTPMNLRYNYYTMLSNIIKEVKPHVDKYERELNKVK